MAVNKGKDVVASASGTTSSGRRRKKAMCPRPESSRKGPKRRREGVLKFVDDAAVEDEEDSKGLSFIDNLVDEEDDELDLGEICTAGYKKDDKPGTRHAKPSPRHHLPFFLKEENLTIEEHEALIRERYSNHVTYEHEAKHTDEIFLHSTKDPTIWKVKCLIGREQQITFSLFQKFIDLHNFGNKLPITSVFALEHVKGFVYIEAEKEADVNEACRGFYTLYTTKKTVVTKDEIPRLISVKNNSCVLSKGTWVRVKSGNYKGDLAQVVAFDDQHKTVMVKLIPRIDLQALAKKFGGGVSLKESGIPTPRLISSRELEDFRPHIQIKRNQLTGENFEILDGMMLKEGYLYKKVSLSSLSWLGVQPSQSELVKFEPAKTDNFEDLNWMALVYGERKKACLEGSSDDLETNRRNDYQVHDLVLFGRKDFGVIIGIKGDSIQILTGDTESSRLATILKKDIKSTCADKMFTASDHHKKNIFINDNVKVLEGPFEGREGIVRHMYKGALFIYDETRTENCGFFCARSQFCLNVKQSKSFKNDKMGSTSNFVDADESMNMVDPSESRDLTSGTANRRSRPMAFDSPFSVGQTVRIRVGPLKGYLCRVTGISRSKATVKLDSLAKVMSVNFTDLSEANIKNFGSFLRDASAVVSDPFGSQDRPIGDSSWNWTAPTFARDSWSNPSSLMAEDTNCNDDSKGGDAQTLGADGGAWVKSSGNINSGPSQYPMDTMNTKITSASENEADTWGWDAKGKGISRDDDAWDKALASQSKNVADGGAWVKSPGNMNSGSSKDPMDAWNVKCTNASENEADTWDKSSFSQNRKDHNNNGGWGSSQAVNEHSGSWDAKGKGIGRDDDAWGKALAFKGENVSSADGAWEKFSGNAKSGPSKDLTDVWDAKGKATITGDAADAWGKSSISHNKKDAHDDVGGWGEASVRLSQKNTLACKSQDGTCDSIAHETCNKWDTSSKVSLGASSENWTANRSAGEQIRGWKKVGTDSYGTGRWGSSRSSCSGPSGNDQGSCWEKSVHNVEQTNAQGDWCNKWNKPNESGGWGFGDGRGRGQDVAHGVRTKSSWGRGWDQNIEGNRRGDWNQPGDLNGDKGTSNDDEVSWNKPKEPDCKDSCVWNQLGQPFDGVRSSEWIRTHGGSRGDFDSGGHAGSGNWNRGGRFNDRGGSSDWNGNHGGGRGRGRGRNFNRDMGRLRNSFGRGEFGGRRKHESSSWNQDREQTIGGFLGSSGRRGGWSTEKGILETPELKKDWQSSTWDSDSKGKVAGGTGSWIEKQDFAGKGSGWNAWSESSKDACTQAGGWTRSDSTENSWVPSSAGAHTGGKKSSWNTEPELSKNDDADHAGGRNNNAPEKASCEPPGTWADRQIGVWEKGCSSKDVTGTQERGWESKTSSCEAGDFGNWNRNAGQDQTQEKKQPTGSSLDGNQGNAWEGSSGGWEEPKNGNGDTDGKGGW